MKVTLPSHYWQFLNQSISAGKYRDESDFIQHAIDALKRESEQKESLHNALRDGENSGFDGPFNFEEFKSKMIDKHVK